MCDCFLVFEGCEVQLCQIWSGLAAISLVKSHCSYFTWMFHVLFHDTLGTADLRLFILYLKYCGHFHSPRTLSQQMWRH
jgi:hypothetical protein